MYVSLKVFAECFLAFFCGTTIYIVLTTAPYNQNMRPVDSIDCAVKIKVPPISLRTISKLWPIFNNKSQ